MSNDVEDYDEVEPYLDINDFEEEKIYTTQEVKEKFLNQVKLIANTWLSYENKSKEEAVNGAIFSVLALIDGCSVDLPGFILAPITSRENQIDAKENGMKYYMLNDQESVFNDIGGSLHDQYYGK